MGIRLTFALMVCMLALAIGAPRSASALPTAMHLKTASAVTGGAVEKVHCYRGRCRPCYRCNNWRWRWYWKNNYNGPYFFYYRGVAYPYYPGYGFYRRVYR